MEVIIFLFGKNRTSVAIVQQLCGKLNSLHKKTHREFRWSRRWRWQPSRYRSFKLFGHCSLGTLDLEDQFDQEHW